MDKIEVLAKELFDIKQEEFEEFRAGCGKKLEKETWEDEPEEWKEAYREDARRIVNLLEGLEQQNG